MRARCMRCWRFTRPVTFPPLCKKHRNQHGGVMSGGKIGNRLTVVYVDGTVKEKKVRRGRLAQRQSVALTQRRPVVRDH